MSDLNEFDQETIIIALTMARLTHPTPHDGRLKDLLDRFEAVKN